MNQKVDTRRTQEIYRAKSAGDFILFAHGLTIPSASGPQLFTNCMSDFQRSFFEDLAPSLHAVRDGNMPPCGRWWLERTKKAAKDSDLAVCLVWLLAFPARPFYAQVGAADRDQAAIVRRRMVDLLFHNPWLTELVDVQPYKAKSIGNPVMLDILAADVAGSHGETPDLLIVNELSHVLRWEFIENLLDNADGVPQGIVIVATNAGFHGTKAEKLRKNAELSDIWRRHLWQRPAPWLSEAFLADAQKRNSRNRFRRLWWGVWVSGKGDALDEEDIDRCFRPGLKPLEEPEPDWQYIGALDLGVSHDHAGLVIVGVHPADRRIRVGWLKGWVPQETTGEVDLMKVEDTCLAMSRRFRLSWLGFDPTEARLMAQRLRSKGVPMEQVSFSSPKNLTDMAQSLVQVVEGGILECYEDDEGRLRRDFGKFNIKEKIPKGFKLEAVSDEFGHADVGTALVICLPRALQMLDGLIGSMGEEGEIAGVMDEDLTPKEVEDMPDELREIYEMEEEEGDVDWRVRST